MPNDGLVDRLGLRPARRQDEAFLYELYAGTRADELAVVPWTDAEKQAFLQQQFNAQTHHYREHFATASFDVIEWRSDDGVLSAGRLYVDRRDDEIRIIDIALLPEYRGRGIGSYLLNALIDEARASQRCVGIHVEHNNPAMRLYQRLGFRHVRDEGVYWFMHWCAED